MSGERIETAGEYTPTTDEVRNGFIEAAASSGTRAEAVQAGVEFDRWLVEYTAEAEARGARSALLDFAAHFEKHGGAWGRMSVVEYIRGEYLDAVAGGSDD